MNELFKTMRLALFVCALPAALFVMVTTVTAQDQESQPLTQPAVDESAVEEIQPAAGVVAVPERHSHVMMIDQANGVSGRITLRGSLIDGNVAAPGMRVTLNRRGRVVAETPTDWDGVFRFDNVTPGSYTFIASSVSAIATFGVYVVHDDDNEPAANEIQVDLIAVGESSRGAREIINRDVEAVVYGFEVSPLLHDLPVTAGPNISALTADGTLTGRVVPLDWLSGGDGRARFDMTGNDVYLFKDNRLAAQVSVEPSGDFAITNVEPAIYDFVSFGPHGAAVFSINVVSHDHVTMNVFSPSMLLTGMVSAAAVPQGVEAVLGEPTSGPTADVDVAVNQPAPGFFGGGGGGGGGAFSGGFADLIGLGLAAWAIAESRNDNNAQVTTPVVLPPQDPPPQSPGG